MEQTLSFVDKYRPNDLKDIVLSNYLKKKLNTIINQKSIPNLLVTGSQSVGKTSIINIICKKIYDGKNYEDYILELNASDDRGLNIINSTIIPFCKKKLDLQKIIILDEADSITSKAQYLLSNVISKYTNTSFIFICIDKFKIFDSIQSRCIILNIDSLSNRNIKNIIIDICSKEKIKVNTDDLDVFILISDNNIRQCINNLECFKFSNIELNKDNINYLFNKPKINLIQKIFESSIKKNLKKSITLLLELYKEGYNNIDIISSMIQYIQTNMLNIDEEQRIKIYSLLSQCYIKINEGNDSELQIYNCICQIYKLNF
uniref:AAA+ ATPase domain-containing protein n=1 Tax=Megaviridae environmental sample TaxID=1737588 RepID=A0A5J6VJY7_9VIRU|nr:MAG: hypothetical protein [Megaviridae environmental sample]